ncbi:hypothetical protein Dimus_036368, partial [Dionaea muscipula]
TVCIHGDDGEAYVAATSTKMAADGRARVVRRDGSRRRARARTAAHRGANSDDGRDGARQLRLQLVVACGDNAATARGRRAAGLLREWIATTRRDSGECVRVVAGQRRAVCAALVERAASARTALRAQRGGGDGASSTALTTTDARWLSSSACGVRGA